VQFSIGSPKKPQIEIICIKIHSAPTTLSNLISTFIFLRISYFWLFFGHPCAVYGSTLKYLLRLRDRFILILFAMFALIWFLLHLGFVLTTEPVR